MNIEVLLNDRKELLVCVMNAGVLRAIGDVIVNETDPLVLVCVLSYLFVFLSFFISF